MQKYFSALPGFSERKTKKATHFLNMRVSAIDSAQHFHASTVPQVNPVEYFIFTQGCQTPGSPNHIQHAQQEQQHPVSPIFFRAG